MQTIRNALNSPVIPVLREAAAVILVAPKKIAQTGYVHEDDPTQRILQQVTSASSHELDGKRDFCVLLVKRAAKSRVMPNTYVFPGGTYDHQSDSDADWSAPYRQAYSLSSLRNEEFLKHLLAWEKWPDPRPHLFRKYHSQVAFDRAEDVHSRNTIASGARLFPAELGFRLCAIRELFEETGLLLARRVDEGVDRILSSSYEVSGVNQLLAFQRSAAEGSQFQPFMEHSRLFPSVRNIYEWSNWTAPTMMPLDKRFDTMFYLSVLSHRPPVNILDDGEVEDSMWADPEEALMRASQNEIILAPPQIYELGRLAQFTRAEDLKKFAFRREELGCPQFFPHIVRTTDDKVVTLLPGDDLYPAQMDLYGGKIPVVKMDKTADQLRASSKNWHRVEFASGKVGSWRNFTFHMNVKPLGGQIKPIENFGG